MSSFCKCKSYSHFFSKNISVYAIFNDQSFNDTLTNAIVSFEQLGKFSLQDKQLFEISKVEITRVNSISRSKGYPEIYFVGIHWNCLTELRPDCVDAHSNQGFCCLPINL